MRFAILGSGAVGGYFGAKLAKSGQDVTFIARGAHLDAIRTKGLAIQSAKLGDFVVKAAAESDTSKVGPVDVVIVAVKAYDNSTALPMLKPMIGADYGRADAAKRRGQRGRCCGGRRRGARARRHDVCGDGARSARADRADRRASLDHLRRGVWRSQPHLAARPGDRRRDGGGGHSSDAGRRCAGADLGQVRVSLPVLGVHRRLAAGHRAHLEIPARAGDVLCSVPRSGGDCEGGRRDDLGEPLRHACRNTCRTSRRRRDRPC